MAIVGAQAYYIPFICDNVGQLILFKKSLDCRILLARALARLNGETDVASIPEPEAHHGVRYGRRPPVHEVVVHTLEGGKVEGRIVVPDGVVRFGTVLNIADISNGYQVTIDNGVGEYSDIGLPVTVV